MTISANKYSVIALVTSNLQSLYLTISIMDCFVQLLLYQCINNDDTFRVRLGYKGHSSSKQSQTEPHP